LFLRVIRTDTNMKEGHVAINPKSCPYCKTKIRACFRLPSSLFSSVN